MYTQQALMQRMAAHVFCESRAGFKATIEEHASNHYEIVPDVSAIMQLFRILVSTVQRCLIAVGSHLAYFYVLHQQSL